MPDLSTPIFLMSPPRKDWSLRGKANFRSIAAGTADATKARQEWTILADSIVQAGGEVLVCPPHEEHPLTGMIYTAEAGEFYRDEQQQARFILPNMATAHRQQESAHIAPFIASLGIQTEQIQSIWEAQGDAIRAGGPERIVHTYGTGPYARSVKSAYAEVAQKLSPHHIQLAFRADPWFHGNTFLQIFRRSADSSLLVLVCPEALEPGELERLRAFLPNATFVSLTAAESQGYDTNSLQVRDTVLAPATLSQTARKAIEAFGLTIQTLDLSELFLKGGGAPVCLTNRLWGMKISELPTNFRWSSSGRIEAFTDR